MNHREHKHGLEIAYWRDGRAADRDEATSCTVTPRARCWPEYRFDLPKQQPDLEKLITTAEAVWQSGDWAARFEIRRVLGVKESR